jgi:hypothetical protein
MKLQLDFGGSEWFYHEQASPEALASLLDQAYEWEQEAIEEEVDEDDE